MAKCTCSRSLTSRRSAPLKAAGWKVVAGVGVVARERGNPLFRPKDGAAKGLVGVRRLLQPVKDDVVGRVQSLPDFLQDHMTFNLDLLLVEGRVQHDVADNIQRKFHVM